ncbi:MAG: 2-oxo acid dehydrogenase subunit E2 [Caldilineales bacterium]|nr:2-oxo acid dehydrogenase subunit E2 [Caldilineales bacterium]MCW5859103.1 2-oxo acid dehydrogenase subunit E2 [Caldilineales bacterium]
MTDTPHVTEPIPPFRQLVIDGMELAARKHCIHGLIEVDISQAREHLRRIKETSGESLSFTGFIVYCCARAVDEDKHLHGYRDWRNRLVLFDDVDVSLPVERQQHGQPVVLQTVIRAANRKSVWQIHREIRALQNKELVDTAWGRWLRWYVLVPRFMRSLFFRFAQRVPTLLKSFNGTVLVTSVGMFGSIAGWGIPLAGHTLCITVGGIEQKPMVENGQITNREHLRLTVTFDHDIIDGGPAARFSQRFATLVQEAAGLNEPQSLPQ